MIPTDGTGQAVHITVHDADRIKIYCSPNCSDKRNSWGMIPTFGAGQSTLPYMLLQEHV